MLDFLCFANIYETKGYFTHQKYVSFATAWYIKVCWYCFTPLTDWQLRAVIIGISPPPGCPPAARFARKYHYHRYLSSLSASSKLAAVHRNNPDYYSAFLWLVGLPTITAKYLLKVIQLWCYYNIAFCFCQDKGLLFVYTDAIFDRQNLMRSALLNDVSKTISPAWKSKQYFSAYDP